MEDERTPTCNVYGVLDLLPLEILHNIAHNDMSVYRALVLALPRFAFSVTNGVRVDYAIHFGFEYKHSGWAEGPADVWTRHGKFHNFYGPAVSFDGHEYWYVNGERHNPDGPAMMRRNAVIAWYKNGKKHNPNGPAIMYKKWQPAYFLDDKECTSEQIRSIMINNPDKGKSFDELYDQWKHRRPYKR